MWVGLPITRRAGQFSSRMLMVRCFCFRLCLDLIFLLAGLILVHDLTNKKTHSHLTKWLSEFHNSSRILGPSSKSAGRAGSTRASISINESFG